MLNWSDDKYKIIVAIAIIVILVMLVYHNNCSNKVLEGLWICDSEFCNESELTGFWIMIGEIDMSALSSYTTMYIVMYNDAGVLCNRDVDVQISHSYNPTTSYINRKLTILNEDFDIMPTSMTLSVNRDNGHMVLYGRDEGEDQDEDTIFGTFYKDNESSHKAKLLREG